MNSNNSLLNLFSVSSRTLTADCWTSTSLRRRPWLGWRTPCWPITGRTRTSTPWWWRGRRSRSSPPTRSPSLRDFRRWERGHLNPQPSTLSTSLYSPLNTSEFAWVQERISITTPAWCTASTNTTNTRDTWSWTGPGTNHCLLACRQYYTLSL